MGNQDDSRCGHTFDPEQWESTLPGVESDLDSEWTCHRDSHADADRCVFHMSTETQHELGITNQEVVEQLLEEIRTGGPESKQFIDATFNTLDLRDHVISPPDNGTLDFRHTTFEGKLRLENATITNEISFHGSRFQQVWMNGVEFAKEANWYGCEFDGTVKADGATFGGKLLFARSVFQYGVRFRKSPTFEGQAVFTGASFNSYARITGGRFGALAYFRDVTFQQANFTNTRFSEAVYFGDAMFETKAHFAETVFGGRTYFGNKDRDDDRDAATIACQLNLTDATIRSLMDFEGVVFRDQQDGSDRDSSADVLLDGLTCTGRVNFAPSVPGDQYIKINVIDARVDAGTLAQPTNGTALYDFCRTTVGDITVTTDPYDESALDAIRFVECDFTEFDFSRYRPALEPDYQIHQFSAIAAIPDNDLLPAIEETTYQKAKTGADSIGDNRAASAFFIREMRARKRRLAAQISQNTTGKKRFEYRLRYETNRFFDLIANYGESARRVIAFSLVTVLGYTGIYGLLYGISGNEPYSSSPRFISYLLLSLESFTGLVHEGGTSVDSWFIRLVAASEGFVGAFLIALFLFALTRSVYR